MLMTLLVGIIILGLLYWVITVLPLPEPFNKIALVVLVIVAIFWLLGLLGVGPGINF